MNPRCVVVLRYRVGLSIEQVGDVLGCAADTASRHSADALATLQAVLG